MLSHISYNKISDIRRSRLNPGSLILSFASISYGLIGNKEAAPLGPLLVVSPAISP